MTKVKADMNNVQSIRETFISKYRTQDFVVSRDKSMTIEIIGASFLADEDTIFGTPNADYIDAEIAWYNSRSTNVFDIDTLSLPKAWAATANLYGEINSNYGHLIHSEKYYDQYNNVLEELLHNPNSRRAVMIYNRPSIWIEYNENGKNDFICTNAVSYYIRNGRLHCCVQMRSNDVYYGYRNDYAWQKDVLKRLCFDIRLRSLSHVALEEGDIYWQVQNLHIYEKHFKFLKEAM